MMPTGPVIDCTHNWELAPPYGSVPRFRCTNCPATAHEIHGPLGRVGTMEYRRVATATPDPRGLYERYKVMRIATRVDKEYGTVLTLETPEGPTFVLEYTQDPHAAVALAAYAKSCEHERPQLAADLREALRGQPECECDEPACQWCEIHGDTGNRIETEEEFDDDGRC